MHFQVTATEGKICDTTCQHDLDDYYGDHRLVCRAFLTTHLRFLKNYNIPEAVSGGLACSILVGAFFLDIANATIIQFFLATPLFR